MKSVFERNSVDEILSRIDKLNPDTKAQWGKMSVSQMLAHCNVTYEMIYDNIHPKPNALMKFILKQFVKGKVVNEGSYPKNSPTAPQFLIKGDRDFLTEKKRLKEYMERTLQLGSASFENKESHSFGKLSIAEWNNMMYKHLDHHLAQFGV
jgi:hypothetical protein